MELVAENDALRLSKGYKQTEVGLIPSDWEVHSLNDEISSLDAGISVNSVNEVIDVANDYAILKTSCVSNGSFIPIEAKKIITSEIQRAKLNPKKNHIIISRMNTPDLVGECGYVSNDYPNLFLPDRLWMMSFKKSSFINARWLNYILNYSIFRQKIRELGTGTSGSMKNISKSKLLEILIPYPNEAEQTVIATALSDADALISSLEKLIAKKRNIKQGAMQKLLQPKEGWEYSSLNDIIYEVIDNRGKTPRLSAYGFALLEVNSLGDLYPNLNKVSKYVSLETYTTWFRNHLLDGDLLFSTVGNVGQTSIYKNTNSCIAQNIVGFRFKNANSIFMKYYFEMDLSKKKFESILMSGVQPSIKVSQLVKLLFSLPSKAEQTRIATILSEMDDEITALETKLEKYKNVKLGMMQNLLMGKIRLI